MTDTCFVVGSLYFVVGSIIFVVGSSLVRFWLGHFFLLGHFFFVGGLHFFGSYTSNLVEGGGIIYFFLDLYRVF